MPTSPIVLETTRKKREKFLEAFALLGNLDKASAASGLSRSNHYHHMAKNGKYAEKFREASRKYLEKMEAEADRRGLEGVEKPVFYKGGICGHIREFSDNLLMFRMKFLNSGYRETPQQVNVNQAVQVNVSDAERRERVKAMILKAQEIDGGEESKS